MTGTCKLHYKWCINSYTVWWLHDSCMVVALTTNLVMWIIRKDFSHVSAISFTVRKKLHSYMTVTLQLHCHLQPLLLSVENEGHKDRDGSSRLHSPCRHIKVASFKEAFWCARMSKDKSLGRATELRQGLEGHINACFSVSYLELLPRGLWCVNCNSGVRLPAYW